MYNAGMEKIRHTNRHVILAKLFSNGYQYDFTRGIIFKNQQNMMLNFVVELIADTNYEILDSLIWLADHQFAFFQERNKLQITNGQLVLEFQEFVHNKFEDFLELYEETRKNLQ